MSRVIALALDSADAGYIDRLVAAGDLPNLARLRARALRVPLRADVAYRAEFPWTEFLTGRRAETLRYWGTVAFDPKTYGCYMRGAAETEPFYAFGDRANVIAFDFAKGARPSNAQGIQVLGWGAHSPQHPFFSQPDGLLAEINSRFSPHPGLRIEYSGSWNQPDYLVEFGNAQATGARRRGEILRWLAEREPNWDLLTTLFGETHQTGHVMWHGACDDSLASDAESAAAARAAFREIHRGIDDALGAVVDWAPADAVIVVFSVQSLIAGDEDAVSSTLLPELLFRRGTGQQRLPTRDLEEWRRQGAPAIVPSVAEKPDEWTRRNFEGPNLAPARAATRGRVHRTMHRYAPVVLGARRRILDRVRPEVTRGEPTPNATFPFHDESMNSWFPATWYRDAWPQLPAFVINSFSDAHIRINLAGRERNGIVALDDYERACDDVERIVRECRNARDAEPIVADIIRVRAHDPLDPEGPTADLVVRVNGTDAIEHPEFGPIGPVALPRTGTHGEFGFVDIAGPTIEPGFGPEHRPCDVSATICALLGQPSSVPLDGRSILGLTSR